MFGKLWLWLVGSPGSRKGKNRWWAPDGDFQDEADAADFARRFQIHQELSEAYDHLAADLLTQGVNPSEWDRKIFTAMIANVMADMALLAEKQSGKK